MKRKSRKLTRLVGRMETVAKALDLRLGSVTYQADGYYEVTFNDTDEYGGRIGFATEPEDET